MESDIYGRGFMVFGHLSVVDFERARDFMKALYINKILTCGEKHERVTTKCKS